MKVEINCREHFSVFGLKPVAFSVDTKWYRGKAIIQTYELEELLGTKLRALYQRKKGRDLFDLYKSITSCSPDIEKILHSFKTYMNTGEGRAPTKKQFLNNMDLKLRDSDFLRDTDFLLRPSEDYDPIIAYKLIRKNLIEKI